MKFSKQMKQSANLFIGLVITVLMINCNPTEPDKIREEFRTPPPNARPQTMWMWVDGNISKEGITKDLEAMESIGVGGFILFNGGLGMPQGSIIYNSKEFHEINTFVLSEAERLGLEANYHNCDGWSSTGGPWIKPENSMKMLIWSDTVLHEGNNSIVLSSPLLEDERKPTNTRDFYCDIVVLAFPMPQNDTFRLKNWKFKSLYHLYERSDFFGSDTTKAPTDAVIPMGKVINLSDKMDATGKLNWEVPEGDWTVIRFGYTSTEAKNRPATKGNIGYEVDKMSRKAMDIHWDSLLNKIIVDADGNKALTTLHIDSYEVGQQNWTDNFNEEFNKRRGYDLLPRLVCLTGRIINDADYTERVLWDLRKTVSELVEENYFGYFAEKCHKQGLQFSNESFGTGPFDAPTVALNADITMTEFWQGELDRNLWQWTTQVISSASHLSGKPVTLAEAFTSMNGNFNDNPYELKHLGDWAFAKGVNRFYFHTMVHQPFNDAVKPGMTFGPYGINFNRNNTWFMKSRAWMEYISRCQYILQSGTYQADILALYGDDRAFNCFIGENEPLDMKYIPGINFDLGGMASIDDLSVDTNGDIRVTHKDKLLNTRYKVLVLKRADLMLPEHVAKLTALADKGAKIYAPKPKHSPSLSNSNEADKTIQDLTKRYWDKGLIYDPKDFDTFIKSMLPDCNVADSMFFNRTRIGEDDYYFISNHKVVANDVTLQFRTSGKQPEIWNPINGKISDATNWKDLGNGITEVQLNMDPVGSAFVVFKKPTTAKGNTTPKPIYTQLLTLNDKWNITFDSTWGPKEPVVYDSLKPWNEDTTVAIKYFSGSATYQTTFNLFKSQLKSPLILDLGRVEIMARVKLNGNDLGTLWKPPFRIDISKALISGNNTLEVEVTNLWVNRLIGDERFANFDKTKLEWLQAGQAPPPNAPRQTFMFIKKWDKEDKLLSSGLIGPVVIESATNK
jgi:hypothetical protein